LYLDMKEVCSTNIKAVGYENGKLIIEFNTGGAYAYQDVPESVYLGFMVAGSKGGYYDAHIKGKYRSTRVG